MVRSLQKGSASVLVITSKRPLMSERWWFTSGEPGNESLRRRFREQRDGCSHETTNSGEWHSHFALLIFEIASYFSSRDSVHFRFSRRQKQNSFTLSCGGSTHFGGQGRGQWKREYKPKREFTRAILVTDAAWPEPLEGEAAGSGQGGLVAN